MKESDIHFLAEYANAFYAYILQYLESKKAPSLPDSADGFGVKNSGGEGFVWKYIYHAERQSPYFMDFSLMPDHVKKRKSAKKLMSSKASVSEEDADLPGGANTDSAEPDAGQEESP